MSVELSTSIQTNNGSLSQRSSILLATGSLFDESSGPYHSVMQTARTLIGRGHRVTVVGTGAATDGNQVGWGVETVAFRRYGPYSMHFAPGVSSWLEERSDWDLASLQGVWLHLHSAVAAWCQHNRRPYMISVRGNFNRVALKISAWKKWLARHTFLRKVLANASCYQALTEAEYWVLREYGVRQPICIIGNGIQIPDLAALPSPESLIPPQFLGRRTLLYLGRLHPIKGIDRLLRAWGRLRPPSNWQLVIAGDGDPKYRAWLEEIARYALATNAYFVGPVREPLKSAWLRHSDLFVLPSHSEGFAMSVLEAFAHGTPALMTTECGFPEAACAGAALVVESTEIAIQRGLEDLIAAPEQKLRDMGARASLFVRNQYDWSSVCTKLESVYSWMRGSHQIPECMRLN